MARLIDADKLIDDIEHSWDMDSVNGITAATVIKQIKTDIKNTTTIKAVPYCEIAKAILQIRSINPRFDYIPRKEVIEILWKLLDERPIKDENHDNDKVIEVIKAIEDAVQKGNKSGMITCPFCNGTIDFLYGNPMAMRAKCRGCNFKIMS